MMCDRTKFEILIISRGFGGSGSPKDHGDTGFNYYRTSCTRIIPCDEVGFPRFAYRHRPSIITYARAGKRFSE